MVLFKFVLIALSTLQMINNANSTEVDGDFCNRQHLKLEMEGSTNIEVDSCEDFYDYDCGNWTQRVHCDQSDHLNKLPLENSTGLEQQAYEFYQSCNNIEFFSTRAYLLWLELTKNLSLSTILTSRELWIWRKHW
ncbi:uncharacterized protein LOC106095114 [Stomoxys calcitrans]|uniref:uncharacterized protein LOC106095114 n=1 Tax=Stomoxys calcitrans TaxID=35570 RepID=UPI0027E3761F|nr:uncharacterized protein LOC106095114 [Stomoxys calcitrans]